MTTSPRQKSMVNGSIHQPLLLQCWLFLTFIAVVTAVTFHDYCIIGAGPSGLQMAYFLQQKDRDYIVFEKSNITGSFYKDYPRHRKLISINKRHTGKTNKEFNLRHDWNSLISHDESLLFRHYSKEMFPHADDFLIYLRDYHQKLKLSVQFNTEINDIQRTENVSTHAKDGVHFEMRDQHGKNYICSKLIVATGVATPNVPTQVPGIEHAEGYESISTDANDYEGQSVLILGRGNAAFETADSIYGATSVIHMVGRSRVRLAWATHYVGDLRAVNNALLDTYQLKSLDGVLEAGLDEVKIAKKGNKFVLQFKEDEEDPILELDNFALREPYDRIIRCLGFKFDPSIFNKTAEISMGKGRKKKFPKLKYNYESENQQGMFFAGVATHSLDFRKSAGGFIHGYRYTARSLHHLLENRYHNVPWPVDVGPITQLLPFILKRINEASGTYQMFGILGDVIILSEDGLNFKYLQEFPINLLHDLEKESGHSATKVIAIVMQYGANFSGPGNDIFRTDRATGEPSDAHNSNFLHPVFYYYDSLPTETEMVKKSANEILPRPKLMHHIVEDFLTSWDAPVSHVLPLRRYLEKIIGQDLRNFFSSKCLQMALTHSSVPLTCQNYLEGEGLVGTHALHIYAKAAGLLN